MNNKYFIWKLVLNTLYEVRIKERSSSLLTFFLIIYAVNAHIRKVKSLKTIRHTSDYLRVCKVGPGSLRFPELWLDIFKVPYKYWDFIGQSWCSQRDWSIVRYKITQLSCRHKTKPNIVLKKTMISEFFIKISCFR